jgi:cell division transport system permease protein
VQATHGAADSVRGRVEVDVYMNTDATAADDSRVQGELLRLPHVKSVQFVSKAQALKQQAALDPQAYTLLTSNPLPDTFHVIADNPSNVLVVHSEITGSGPGGGLIDPSIQKVSNNQSDTEKILEVTNLVTLTAAVLTVLLVLASILLIGNTIRLSLYARRREVEVMKLVGATDWFIRWPFVIEGVIVGALGALCAICLLGVTKLTLLDPIANNWTLIAAPRTIAFPWLIAVLLGAGVVVSALGSGLSLRRFLRV